jgi:predicted metal-dependent hydrolase
MNQSISYSLLYRKVKHLRIEVESGRVRVIVPRNYSLRVEDALQKHQKWIESKLAQLEELKRISKGLKLYNHPNLEQIVEYYVEEYSKILKVKPEKVSFRWMKNRWGSCNFKEKQLNFNKRLKYLPKDLIKFVVLHEVCHLLVKNHKKEFWFLVSRLDRNFKEKEKLLQGYKFRLEEIEKV